MCLIAFAIDAHEEYPFILIANRDEFYKRPTSAAHEWDDLKIIAGRDLQAGGTWMGLTRKGKFAAVTNYRDPNNIRADATSRGEIPTKFLSSDDSANDYVRKISSNGMAYNGFNLLASDLHEMHHFSNYEGVHNVTKSGIHGLSNALLDSPWPKVEKIKARLASTIASDFSTDDLLDILGDQGLADDEALPQTGIPTEWEKALSAVCIRTEEYGTCCSTIVLRDRNDHLTFVEKTYEVGNRIPALKNFSFKIQ